jgi:hypothetical protein
MHSTFPSGKCQMFQQEIHCYSVGSEPTKWRHNHVNTYCNIEYALLATCGKTGTYPARISATLVTFCWTNVWQWMFYDVHSLERNGHKWRSSNFNRPTGQIVQPVARPPRTCNSTELWAWTLCSQCLWTKLHPGHYNILACVLFQPRNRHVDQIHPEWAFCNVAICHCRQCT